MNYFINLHSKILENKTIILNIINFIKKIKLTLK